MALPIWQRTIVTEAGDVVPGAAVEVINESTGVAATIYSDRNGTVPVSDLFADSSGFAQFYASPGEYRITATGVSGTVTWRYALVGGKAELSSYDNTTSGATAVNVQTALDEAFGTMVNLTGDQTITGVKTFSKTIQSPLGSSYVGGAILVNGLSATFTNATNNINAVGIGVGVEIGDVIQISGSTNNNGEFTVEVITDANNVIVNQAHAGGTTSKALVNETATVTVKLLCKWYLAPPGLGQGWVNVLSSRVPSVGYSNPTNRTIKVGIIGTRSDAVTLRILIDSVLVAHYDEAGVSPRTGWVGADVPKDSTYSLVVNINMITEWAELR